jgi:hypothetical protein
MKLWHAIAIGIGLGLIAIGIGLGLLAFGASCAHVTPVVAKCEGDAAALIPTVIPALAAQDYEAAIAKATVGIAPCLVIAAVQEIVDSLSAKAQFAGAPQPLDATIVQRHGREWLATHQ